MRIEQLYVLSEEILDELLDVWDRAVRSTHHFLSEKDIAYFRPLVRNQYFQAVRLFVIRNERSRIAAFMGLSDDMLEMLFVSPEEQGNGYGKALVNYAIRMFNIKNVDVNEDNKSAYQFYLYMGYEAIGRSDYDSFGKPFPIVHLRHR